MMVPASARKKPEEPREPELSESSFRASTCRVREAYAICPTTGGGSGWGIARRGRGGEDGKGGGATGEGCVSTGEGRVAAAPGTGAAV
eukprot:5621558-Prymnesium_polylepis.1